MRPLLYFSYGMTKTGSTLAFQMVRSALDICGFPQDRLALDVVKDNANINFVNQIDQRQLDELICESERRGYPFVLKTHARPNPCVVKMIQRGEALAFATYRDPRDMALSMLDHGRRSRANGIQSFSEIHNLETALKNIRHQFDSLTAWLRLPDTIPLFFDDIAFDTVPSISKTLSDLNLSFDAGILADIVLNQRFTQKNKGKRNRYLSEMEPDKSAQIAAEFSPFIERFITNRNQLATDGSILLPPPLELRLSTLD